MNTKATVASETAQAGGFFCEVPSDPCAIVMFGASGDLARRKLLPALYDLSFHACLGPRFRLLGFARTEMTDNDFVQKAGEFLPSGNQEGADDGKKAEFLKCLRYFSGNYDDPETFRRLAQRLGELDSEGQWESAFLSRHATGSLSARDRAAEAGRAQQT
jgi:glucose-6-phosphate 1-dehydrogenase